MRVRVRGAVQGVGFRPFVFGLAKELSLCGFVTNSAQGAEIEIEGARSSLDAFLRRLPLELPFPGHVAGLEASTLPPRGFASFEIAPSTEDGPRTATVLPDIATCPRCLAELRDPGDRRYRYPFTNCTHCGPRYSIIHRLPYDRKSTSMERFPMCPECRAEYEDPSNRRFHAQPNACPVCGPHVEFRSASGERLASHDEAFALACEELRAGRILAVKGIGGFHLMADARNEEAVRRLRERKRREAKPLAVMVPSLEWARGSARLSETEERLLSSPEAPIVIVRAEHGAVAPSVAPDNPHVGLMAPYSPLHWILMGDLGFPVVATSGNLSEEPICTDEAEAVSRFRDIADGLLVHDRPIVRPIDDSVARVMADRPVVFRRARGYAPLPLDLPGVGRDLLAVGGHLKNAVALSLEGSAVVGQHVGDLDNGAARKRMAAEAADIADLYELRPRVVVHDLHPDYATTRYAEESGLAMLGVQHHVAHAAACLAENELEGSALAVVWDGTGYGTDGTIWGGEFFAVEDGRISRVAWIRPFPLPGGEIAIKETRRSGLGLLAEAYGRNMPAVFEEWTSRWFEPKELGTLQWMLESHGHCARTSSAGRLFDAFAALGAGSCASRFEGDVPMRFEHLAEDDPGAYEFELEGRVVSWLPALEGLGCDLSRGASQGTISARFHRGLALAICSVAERLGYRDVALSGGCFQNRLLFEETCRQLAARGFRAHGHQRVPPGDGGLAFGQLAAARYGWGERLL